MQDESRPVILVACVALAVAVVAGVLMWTDNPRHTADPPPVAEKHSTKV